jgi:hypothetical protein
VNTLLKLKVFHNIPRKGSITAKELAVIVNIDLEVLSMRYRQYDLLRLTATSSPSHAHLDCDQHLSLCC